MRVLLAEELLVLRMGPKLEGRIEDSVETGLVAAIVCELIFAERLVVEWQQHIDDHAVRVIDSRPVGDDLLDDALLLLGGGSTHAARQLAQHPKLANGVVSRRVWRRIHVRGRVTKEDLPFWWSGAWKCAWLEDLAPTLLYQLLLLHEGLDRAALRVRGRLGASGILIYRGGDASVDATVYRDVRERIRAGTLEHARPLDPRLGHLVALRSSDDDWLKRDIGGDRRRRQRAHSQAQAVVNDFPVAKAARIIVQGHQAMLNWYDG